jgi:hypothetical protein
MKLTARLPRFAVPSLLLIHDGPLRELSASVRKPRQSRADVDSQKRQRQSSQAGHEADARRRMGKAAAKAGTAQGEALI